jgi:hypothetical protein
MHAAELAAPRPVVPAGMRAAELAAAHPVLPGMMSFALRRLSVAASSRWRVRPALLVTLALSLLLHLVWSMWPIEFTHIAAPEEPALVATLTEMPPPPLPAVAPPPAPATVVARAPAPKHPPKPRVRRIEHPPVITAPGSPVTTDVEAQAPATSADTERAATAMGGAGEAAATASEVVIGPPAPPATPPVVLPPRLDLAYKVFFGTHGFMIGDATYRFEHTGDRYRISTIGQARGLAALIVHGTGKVESRGRITPDGLKPYEFAVERGSADKREVALFDWDARDVVLHDGTMAPLEAPAFDPLTILWQPYFSPPSGDDQTFSLATTRRVARYTLSLEGEETIAWHDDNVPTQRWHERSDDGKTEGWFWLAPSMHYIPLKMRVTRTSRGTLEVLLDSIRADESSPYADASKMEPENNPAFQASDPTAPFPGPESHGQ